ncbi:hypothetical protein AF68_05720 [Streptococcus uberis B362]|nr:hypothetical protein AF68_05720 [Streptococcus uberis B362]
MTTKKNWPQGLPPQKENGCPGTAFDALRYLKTKDTLYQESREGDMS